MPGTQKQEAKGKRVGKIGKERQKKKVKKSAVKERWIALSKHDGGKV